MVTRRSTVLFRANSFFIQVSCTQTLEVGESCRVRAPGPGSRISREHDLRNWVIKRQASSVSRLKAARALAYASKLSGLGALSSGRDDGARDPWLVNTSCKVAQ